jgi:hypothetical protein
MKVVRRVILPAALGALLLGVTATPGMAMTTYSGHCDFAGVLHLFPNSHVVPEPLGYSVTMDGTCDGILNGEPYKGPMHMEIYANMHAPMSCVIGFSANGGPWYISFPGAAKPASAAAPASSRKASASRKQKARAPDRTASKRKRKHRRRKHPRPPKPPPYQDPPAAPEVPELAAWSSSTNGPPGEVIVTYHGAYRGVAVGVNWFESDPSTLNTCLGPGIEGGKLEGSFDTVQELRG